MVKINKEKDEFIITVEGDGEIICVMNKELRACLEWEQRPTIRKLKKVKETESVDENKITTRENCITCILDGLSGDVVVNGQRNEISFTINGKGSLSPNMIAKEMIGLVMKYYNMGFFDVSNIVVFLNLVAGMIQIENN